jgi:hypothetical protein
MRTQITLYGDDSEWFEDLKEDVADHRDGNEPTNAELARLMMEQFDADS